MLQRVAGNMMKRVEMCNTVNGQGPLLGWTPGICVTFLRVYQKGHDSTVTYAPQLTLSIFQFIIHKHSTISYQIPWDLPLQLTQPWYVTSYSSSSSSSSSWYQSWCEKHSNYGI
jgi:hypothetical protein